MATVLSNISVSVKLARDFVADFVNATASHSIKESPAVGNAAGEVNVAVTRTLSVVGSGTPTVLDLTALVDDAGNTHNLTKLTHWAFQSLTDTAIEIFTCGGGANPVIPADSETVQRRGWVAKSAGTDGRTVDGTHKNFQVAVAAGTNVPGVLTIYGRE